MQRAIVSLQINPAIVMSAPVCYVHVWFAFSNVTCLVSFIATVKVVKFNRKRPLPDAQNVDFVSQNYGDAPGSLSITGYRSVLRHSSSL